MLLFAIFLGLPFIFSDSFGNGKLNRAHTFNIFFTDTITPGTITKDTIPKSKIDSLKKDSLLSQSEIFEDSISKIKPVLEISDTTPIIEDSSLTRVDTVHYYRLSPDSLDSRVTFRAKDSIVMYFKKKKFYLYNDAETNYKDLKLTAAQMNFSQETGTMEAINVTDSTGKKIGQPVFVSGGQETKSDTIRYNFESQKAKIYETKAIYGEGFVASEQIKKMSDDVIFGFKNGYTTCNLDTPHFAFRAKKIKVITNKLIVSGPANLEIEGIPTPLFIPFAIFPITQGQSSGILPPQYVVNAMKGIGLENGGYYLGLGEYLDVTVRGNVYSYGSWGLSMNPTYRKRYKYNGGFTVSLSNTRTGDPAVKQDFVKSKDFAVTWNHSMDSKARPGTNFNASVNVRTSSYNQYNVTDYQTRLTNTLSSSISYSKSWAGKPYNLTLSAGHSQNTSTREMTISLPQATFTVNTLYPFQSKDGVTQNKWYEKLGIGYSVNMTNRTRFTDSLFGKQEMFDNLQTGFQHQVPISFSIPVLKNFTLSPSVSYGERWYTKRTVRSYNESLNKVDTAYEGGFYAIRNVSTGISLSTALYGMYAFKKNMKVDRIRHVMRPTVSLSYTPDLNRGAFYNLRYDTAASAVTRVSYYDDAVYGAPSYGTFAGLSFGLDNNLEMRVRSDKDSTGSKKIKLLDGFGFNGSYNLVADSFQLSTIQLYARTNLFDKLNISFNGTIDPYQLDSLGRRIDKYTWQGGQGFKVGRLTNAGVSLSTSFQSGDKKSKQKEQMKDQIENTESNDAMLEAQRRQMEMIRANPGEYVDFDIPWRLDLSYSLQFNRGRTSDYRRDTTIFTQSLNFNGDFSLTPKWKVGMTSGYDFRNHELTYTTMYITRDMHCWQMSINLVPFGSYRQFSITINPKAGILRDLRINRTRQFMDY
ncbi:putative LPS assembly protein LptD [Chitinophaga caeni]|uniref:putative LPS assembly protein LptD n=1 Tax=Chitinophaga caeni TaxID=2029983 RepID=UPI0012FD47CE|nr:putative LPS assembly protein LptD [Chitinophaga caeni]